MPETLAPTSFSLPTPVPAAPAPAPMAPPDVSGAPPSADLSALTQPSPQPSAGGSQEGQVLQGAVAGENQALQNVRQLSQPTPPAAPVPHERLLAMVSGLATGLSAFGTSLATHGREGGAQEVAQIQGEQQRQKIEAQQAQQAQKNAQIQQQLTVADTNHKLAQNILLLATLPNELTKSNLETAGLKMGVAEKGLDVAAKAQNVFDTTGRIPQGWTADERTGQLFPEGQAPAPTSVGPTASSGRAVVPATPSVYDRRANVLLDSFGRELQDEKGNEDPTVVAAHQIFANPDATIEQKQQALIAVQQKAGLSEAVTKDLTAKADLKVKQESAETGGVVGKLSTPEALAAPGAQAAIQAQIDSPNNSAKEVAQLRALLPQAAVAQLNAENIKQREARNQQLVNQGDPDEAGRLLADRSLTLSELKARQVTPKFIADAVVAAQKYDPNFKAAEAEAQGKIAASPANSQFFGNTDSLLVRGGTLDQLAAAYKALGNTKIPVINKLDNLRKAAVGNGPIAAAYAAQLGVADDYSKVISGGSGSDTSRQQALDIMALDLSPAGQDAAINQIRQTVESQRNGRVGTNPYMKDMYPDPVTRQETPGLPGTQPATAPKAAAFVRPAGVSGAALLMQAPGGQPHWIEPGPNMDAAKKLGATEVR